MKNLIEKALEVHEELRGEIITPIYLAAIMWPKRLEPTQRNNFSSLKNGKTKLHKKWINILCDELPDTNADYWCGRIDFKRELSIFESMYPPNYIEENEELALLYQYLLDEKYSVELYNNYL